MPQDDYSLANASGSAFRADANNQLAAIREKNSGTGFPSSVAANMEAVHTVDGIRYRRNNANTAWVPEANISAQMTEEKTTTYSVTIGDFGKMIEGNPSASNLTFNLPAVAGVPDGWYCWIRNGAMNRFDIRVTSNGTELIDDSTSWIAIPMMQGCLLWCTGSEWKTLRTPKAGMEFMMSQTAAGDSEIDFDQEFESGFDYEILIDRLVPTNDAVDLRMRLSIAGVFQIASGDYSYYSIATDADDSFISKQEDISSTFTNHIKVGGVSTGPDFSSDVNDRANLRVLITNPMNGGIQTGLQWSGGGISAAGDPMYLAGWGRLDAGASTDGIRFYFENGTVASGSFMLRRMVRS